MLFTESSLEEQSVAEIQHYFTVAPNPTTTGYLTLKWDDLYRGKVSSIEIYSANKQKIPVSFTSNATQTTVNISSQPTGYYFVYFKLDDTRIVYKTVIKK